MKKGYAIWLMGIPCSGKTTLARVLREKLEERQILSKLLDGDELRRTICADLGFSDADRAENIRRAAEIAKLFVEEGFFVICAFITPKLAMQRMVRDILQERLLDIYLECDVEECISRDVKGLYKKAIEQGLQNLTGYNAPFDVPVEPFLKLNTKNISVHDSLRQIEKCLDPYIVDHERLRITCRQAAG